MPQYRLGEGPYGSAYRGDIADIFASGDLKPIETENRTFGLFLGRVDWQWTFQHKWKEAGRGLLAYYFGSYGYQTRSETIGQTHDIRFTGDQHHLVVAGTGAGKFRDALSNMLLFDGSCETSCLIIDPKGEIATKTGPMIDGPDTPDQRTLILDPWNVCGTGTTAATTFLEGLTPDNPHSVKDARILADAIIVHREGDGGHWDATAKNFLTALLLYLGTDPIEEGTRHLRRLRELVTLPWTVPEGSDRIGLNSLLEYLAASDMFSGIVGRSVQAFLNREQKERSYILSTIERDTEFVEDPALWQALDQSTVDLRQLVVSNKRLHVVLPFDYITPMRSWLRLAIAAYYNACLRHALPDSFPSYLKFRHIIIDEFASLGKLDFMIRDIAEARGAGIKHHLVVQSLTQLKGLYGDIWENFASNSFIQAFGISDLFTSEYLSKLTGQATVVTETKAFSSTTSSSRGHSSSSSSTTGSWQSTSTSGTNYSSSSSSSITNTFSSTGRPVLMPDEIRRISNQQQLLFFRGMPVLLVQRAPYYELFKDFLPKYSLKELPHFKARLTHGRAGTGAQIVCKPFTAADNAKVGIPHRSSVNSRFKTPSFIPPPFKTQTLREALISDWWLFPLAALLLAGSIYLAVQAIEYNSEQKRLEAQRLQDEEAARKRAAEEAERERRAAAAHEAAERARRARLMPRPAFTPGPDGNRNIDWSSECERYRGYIQRNIDYCTSDGVAAEADFMSHLTQYAYKYCSWSRSNQPKRSDVMDAVNTALFGKWVFVYNGSRYYQDGLFKFDKEQQKFTTNNPTRLYQAILLAIDNNNNYLSRPGMDNIAHATKALYAQGCPFGRIDPTRYDPPPAVSSPY